MYYSVLSVHKSLYALSHYLAKDCDDLTPPKNGARACDDWMFGRFCLPFCNNRTDFSESFPEKQMWVCGTDGIWKPTNYLPDCTSTNYLDFTTNLTIMKIQILTVKGIKIVITCYDHWKFELLEHFSVQFSSCRYGIVLSMTESTRESTCDSQLYISGGIWKKNQ